MRQTTKLAYPELEIPIEKEPEIADKLEKPEPDLQILKKKLSCRSGPDEIASLVAKRRTWEPEGGQVEKPVKIISYFGSLPNEAGNDGDFYVDEMTNMLYGPKVDGVWPEEGVNAAGLCKRTFIAMTSGRPRALRQERRFGWNIWLMLRFVFTGSLGRRSAV